VWSAGKLIETGGVDIKSLVADSPEVVKGLGPALERHNKEQLTAVKLPGASKSVRIAVRMQDTTSAVGGGVDGGIG